MTRRARLITLVVVLCCVALGGWIATHTHWEDVKIPSMPKGEALTNPFYAAQHFAGELGARTSWDHTFTAPSSDAVIVLSSWHWSLNTTRRENIERWVEAGGRLVVDSSLNGDGKGFEQWSGLGRTESADTGSSTAMPQVRERCLVFEEERASGEVEPVRVICDTDRLTFLKSARPTEWVMRGKSGPQAMRVRVGRGSVTVVNAAPFQTQRFFDGDHAWLLVAATELRRGDELHFLSDGDQPSLLALVWINGRPVVVLVFMVIALLLWRSGVRFGPLIAPQPSARRSLAEQIRGTGQFARRQNGEGSLFGAVRRALDEAAVSRIPRYAGLATAERASTLSRLTRLDRWALGNALHDAGARRPQELRTSIALLEEARRRTLKERTRSSHGAE